MWTVLAILLWLLAAVLALLLAALASPTRIECRASAGEGFRYRVALRPFGRLGPRLAMVDSEKPSKERKTRKPKTRKKAKTGKSSRRDPRRILAASVRLISDVFARLSIEEAAIDLRFGTGDPAETGEIYGQLTPLVYGTWGSRSVRMNVEPVFDRAIFDGRAALDVTMTPMRLIPPLVRFGWTAFGPRP